MTPTKQTVYLPVEGLTITEFMECKEGYFFSSEQLNEYTANVIKQALETGAENADSYIDMNEDTYVEGNIWSEVDKESITDTFEETYQKFKV